VMYIGGWIGCTRHLSRAQGVYSDRRWIWGLVLILQSYIKMYMEWYGGT